MVMEWVGGVNEGEGAGRRVSVLFSTLTMASAKRGYTEFFQRLYVCKSCCATVRFFKYRKVMFMK